MHAAWFAAGIRPYPREIHLLHTSVQRGIIRDSAPGRGKYCWRLHGDEVDSFYSCVLLDVISAGAFNSRPKGAKEE
jgi:hypothetical protein